MPNTTIPAIRAKIISVVEAATPTRFTELTFRRINRRYKLDEFAKKNSANMRKFELYQEGTGEELSVHSSSVYRQEPFVLLVAYPKLSGYAGVDELDDLRDMMREDYRVLRDVIRSPGNYLSGECERTAPIANIIEDDDVWVLELSFSVGFYEVQSITAVASGTIETPDQFLGSNVLLWLDSRQGLTLGADGQTVVALRWAEHASSPNSTIWWSDASGTNKPRSPALVLSDTDGTASLDFNRTNACWLSESTGGLQIPAAFTIYAFYYLANNAAIETCLSGSSTVWEWNFRGNPLGNDKMGHLFDGGSGVATGPSVTSVEGAWTLFRWSMNTATGDWTEAINDSAEVTGNTAVTIGATDLITEVSFNSYGGGKQAKGRFKLIIVTSNYITDADDEHQSMLDYVASEFSSLTTW